eukprot:scaffold441211_cov22-Prasinocladus_malaysianus.AAC.1
MTSLPFLEDGEGIEAGRAAFSIYLLLVNGPGAIYENPINKMTSKWGGRLGGVISDFSSK